MQNSIPNRASDAGPDQPVDERDTDGPEYSADDHLDAAFGCEDLDDEEDEDA